MRVLVVDDDVRILRFIRLSLRLAGYTVTTAASGEEALELFKSEPADIVVLDLLLPVMDGFTVLRELRAFSRVPVIAVSAHASAAGEALKLGANEFVCKPFNPEELLKSIGNLLQGGDKQPS